MLFVIEGYSIDDVCAYIQKKRWDIIGIPAFTLTLPMVKKLCIKIREIDTKVHICIGGPHTKFYPEKMLEYWPEIDTIVVGYGEQTFYELVDALEKRTELSHIKGLVYRKDGKILLNEAREVEKTYIDDFILPRDMLQYKKYSTYLCNTEYSTIVVTSRGCPFKCHFCSNYYENSFGVRKTDNIIKELKEIRRLGIREVLFLTRLLIFQNRI